MKFSTTPEQQARIAAWDKEQNALVIAKRQEGRKNKPPASDSFDATMAEMEDEDGIPYTGAIGGHLAYTWHTPSSQRRWGAL